MERRLVLATLAGAHLVIAALHGVSHSLLPVVLGPVVNGVVLVTVFLGPIVGVGLAYSDHPLGVPLFTVSMGGALLFGGLLHFVVESPDHIHALPAGQWRLPFQVSAGLLLVTEGVGTGIGAWYWRRRGS